MRGSASACSVPSGAGKTTTVSMLTGTSPVTDGTLRVGEFDVVRQPRAVKRTLGVVPQEDNLDPDLPVHQNLEVYARYYGMSKRESGPRIDNALELFHLTEKADEPVDALSGGMKRRLTIAQALVQRSWSWTSPPLAWTPRPAISSGNSSERSRLAG